MNPYTLSAASGRAMRRSCGAASASRRYGRREAQRLAAFVATILASVASLLAPLIIGHTVDT